jgi:hypothetical protein
MQKNGSYKNCKSLHRAFRSRQRESGQALTEYVLVVSVLAMVVVVALGVASFRTVALAFGNNVGILAYRSVEDAPFYVDWIHHLGSPEAVPPVVGDAARNELKEGEAAGW